jgi:dephospho-CoA kinase
MEAENAQTIIAIVGQPASGKDTAAAYLVDRYCFSYVSTSDLLRDLARSKGVEHTDRAQLGEFARHLRLEQGPDILVRMAHAEGSDTNRIVIGGLRAKAEANAIHALGGVIVSITVPIELRFERAKLRGRIDDRVSFEHFKTVELEESANNDGNAQSLNQVMEMADYQIENGGTEEDFYRRVDEVVAPLLSLKQAA